MRCRYCIRPPRGVLLHGPPGSGKTVLAKAAAAEAGATLLVVNGPDIVSEYFGECFGSATQVVCMVQEGGRLFEQESEGKRVKRADAWVP
jgi:ATP-dependent 26S proteasome regulatory subunit